MIIKGNITLLSPPSFCVDDDRLEQSLGIAYIASVLIENGYDANIVELTGNQGKDFNEISALIPCSDIYGIVCYSTTYHNVKKIIESIKNKNPKAYICLGGPHPTAMPEQTLRDMEVDCVVTGEGEMAFLSIVDNFYNKRKKLKGVISIPGPDNLDSLPFPNRELVDQSSFSRTFQGKKTMSLISGRGCKFDCLHCNSNIMGAGNRKVRFRSVENIIEEIRYLKNLGLGHEAFRFNDDNFADHPDLVRLLKSMAKEHISYRIFSRLEHLSDDNLKLFKASGCNFISIGLESLNEKNLKYIGKGKMLKHIDNLTMAKKYGITIRSSFMVGLPYDTDASVKNDFEKASELDFDEYAIYPLIPYPGTRLWRTPERYGYEISNKNFTDYVQMGGGGNKKTDFVLKHTDESGYTFFPDDVKRWYDMAHQILDKKKNHMSSSSIAR
ncbi:B12-binding domain-containing radical SAM protein [Desulfobacula phenolica]|uniref:Radical SAM superfamily enzyme YgiQ, UPF0313 family n=1 Tax=Desulfobacula phenolica TaxID=90732 RepID=A0A1H2K8J1_9BACT|nr:radical SAM protein [Desulfobacula phenolica]SDU64893.1 Radical SAM superfamily enzyme YgiQ, UPF0313 family [Desulfobacula phenolica]